jgi:uncharacterized protein (DUF1800 family)
MALSFEDLFPPTAGDIIANAARTTSVSPAALQVLAALAARAGPRNWTKVRPPRGFLRGVLDRDAVAAALAELVTAGLILRRDRDGWFGTYDIQVKGVRREHTEEAA